METTGHQSLDGVRNYKWTSVEQQQVVSDILSLAKKPRNECSEPTDVSPPVHCSKKTTEHFRGGTQPNQGNIYPEHGGFCFINCQNVTINLKVFLL